MSSNIRSVLRVGDVAMARKCALAGVGLFIVGFVLNGVGNTVSRALVVVPYADTLTALGFVIALFSAVLSGGTIREILVVGVTFGVGTFYVGEPHSTHMESGLGLGLEHMSHIFLGLALIASATALSALLTFINTRTTNRPTIR